MLRHGTVTVTAAAAALLILTSASATGPVTAAAPDGIEQAYERMYAGDRTTPALARRLVASTGDMRRSTVGFAVRLQGFRDAGGGAWTKDSGPYVQTVACDSAGGWNARIDALHYRIRPSGNGTCVAAGYRRWLLIKVLGEAGAEEDPDAPGRWRIDGRGTVTTSWDGDSFAATFSRD